MIVCTKSVDALARRALGKDKIIISTVSNLIPQLQLDPEITTPKKEAFIISETDIAKPKVMEEFKAAAAGKHPEVTILVVARPKTTLTAGNGINKVLISPKPEQLTEAIAESIEEIADKAIQMQQRKDEGIEDYQPVEFQESQAEEEQETTEETIASTPEELPIPEVSLESPLVTEHEAENEILQRLKECRSVADVSIVAREITATKVVKDLMEENQEYVAIEERLKALQKQIYSVMVDPTIPSVTDKWEKIRAITYDKSYYAVKGTSLLESRVEEIIRTLGDKTKELLEQKIKDVDKTILFYSQSQKPELTSFPNLSSLLDTRANLILDLVALAKENASVFHAADSLITEVSNAIVRTNTEMTGNVVLDNQLKARGVALTSSEGLNVISKMLEVSVSNAAKFAEHKDAIDLMNRKVADLMKADDAVIAIQNNIIKYLTANGVEDAVVATSFIKKALRIFVGEEGSGRTIVPYIISKIYSRTSANVLYVDLTGTSKLSDYGIKGITLHEWMDEMPEKQFCAVVGEIQEEDTKESIVQRISNKLVRAADYYRVINVAIRPDQKLLFDTLAPDTLSVNYITDMSVAHLDNTRKIIEETTVPNVAQKVIANKCPKCTEAIVRRLGLMDRLNIGYLRIPYIQQLVDCSLEEVDPSAIDTVNDLFMEVMKDA